MQIDPLCIEEMPPGQPRGQLASKTATALSNGEGIGVEGISMVTRLGWKRIFQLDKTHKEWGKEIKQGEGHPWDQRTLRAGRPWLEAPSPTHSPGRSGRARWPAGRRTCGP